MLRLLIGTGLLLMVVGFGAAGWQYWQGLPASPDSVAIAPDGSPASQDAPEAPAEPSQNWLISPTGGLVPRANVRAFLAQDRLVPDRTVTVTLTAPLSALLTEGEMLPTQPFLQVFADIRAPQVARALCPVLTDSIAAACAVDSARALEDSVDPARGTARFRVDLAYRLKPSEGDLPDLGAHILNVDLLAPGLAAQTDAAPPAAPASAETALAAALAEATAACADPARALGCRLLRLSLDWQPGAPLSYRAELGWLAPLPEGMFPAPPIPPLTPEG
jgi:hypothetical protein